MASRIQGITVEIGGDTTKLSKALESVNKDIRNTQSQLKDVNKLLKMDPGNADLIGQKQKYLSEAIDDTKKKLEQEKDALSQLKEGPQSEETLKQQEALTREIEDTKQKLKGLTDEYKNFGSVAGAQLQAAGDKMKEVGGKISDAGETLTTHVTLPLAAAGAAGVANFASVDKTMQLANKTMGNTAEQAETVNKAMKDAAANSTYGMNDAANAVLNFARAGLDADQSAAALAPAMNLAAGEGGNLDTVSAGLVATINGFHGSFEDAGTYADVFAAACNNSALDVDSLSNAMSVAAPIFSSAGYSVNDAALFMGVMANNGIQADVAANSLKTGLARLVSPAKEGADMMEQLGISVTNSDGSMKDSVTIQKELHDAFSKLSESEQIAAASAIFGKNQMAPWLALINTAPGDVNELNSSLEACGGTTQEMADTMMSGFGGSLEKLKSSVDVLGYSIGESLAPILQKAVDFIQGIVDKLNAMDPSMRQVVVTIGLIAAAVGPVLVIAGNVISAVGTITGAIGSVMTHIGALSGGITALSSMSLLPMLGVIALVVGAIIGIIAIVKNWGAISEWFKGVWEGVCNGVKEIGQGLGEFFGGLWDGIKTATSTAWDGIKSGVSTAWNGVKDTVSTVGSAIKDTAKQHLDAMKSAFDQNGGGIKGAAAAAWEGIKGYYTAGFDFVNNLTGGKLDGIKQKFSDGWNAVKEKTSEAWSNIKGTVEQNGGGIKGVITTAVQGYQNIWKTGFGMINQVTGGKLGEALSTATSKLSSIKQAFTDKMNGAKEAVKGAIDKIKGFFNFQWSLPKLKMPHFSFSGKFSLNPPSVPHFSVSWYKKAMDNGMVLNSPTIFGAKGNTLLAGGEAGAEAVVGVGSLETMISEAVASQTGALTAALAGVSGGGNITIPVYIGGDKIDEVLVKSESRRNLRSGGR